MNKLKFDGKRKTKIKRLLFYAISRTYNDNLRTRAILSVSSFLVKASMRDQENKIRCTCNQMSILIHFVYHMPSCQRMKNCTWRNLFLRFACFYSKYKICSKDIWMSRLCESEYVYVYALHIWFWFFLRLDIGHGIWITESSVLYGNIVHFFSRFKPKLTLCIQHWCDSIPVASAILFIYIYLQNIIGIIGSDRIHTQWRALPVAHHKCMNYNIVLPLLVYR